MRKPGRRSQETDRIKSDEQEHTNLEEYIGKNVLIVANLEGFLGS
jgi:hypothetical protein